MSFLILFGEIDSDTAVYTRIFERVRIMVLKRFEDTIKNVRVWMLWTFSKK